jgi:hypothetical protein
VIASSRALCLLVCLMLGCGAKTGLLVPDAAAPDDLPDARDVVDAADVCVGRSLPVERFVAEVIFVIDRSGSMAEVTPSGATRWQAITGALGRVLPAFDRDLWMGLIQFPRAVTEADQCGDNSGLDVLPRLGNSGNILASLGFARPFGGTPTFAALQSAAQHFRTTPPVGRVRGRYLILATDGGPNCNGSLPAATCTCTGALRCQGLGGALSCLDDVRTIELVRSIAREGVGTFVIGVPGAELGLPETLNALATAGGRPRPNATAYFPAQDSDEWATAFREISTALVRCRYVTNPVADPSQVSVSVGGRAIARDPSHTDGWDWVSAGTGELVVYGPACDAAQRAGNVTLRYGCVE